MRALYVVGPPGVGKTTLVLALTDRLDLEPGEVLDQRAPLLRGQRWHDTYGGGIVLGRKRPRFGGTDALSMAALPQAIAWARESTMPANVIGEGQRLAHISFLEALSERGNLTVVSLDAPPEVLSERCDLRGSDQNPQWMRGATTRARNVVAQSMAAHLDVLPLNATHPVTALVAECRDALGWD
jgi:ribose 1,5-bisphosphokinase PhnN